MFDSHCHLQDLEGFERDDLESMLEESSVSGVLIASSHSSKWKEQLDFSIATPALFKNAVGIHPWDQDATFEDLVSFVQQNTSHISAIGEVGVDSIKTPESVDAQLALCEKQVGLANDLNLPIVVHAVKAHDSLIATLKSTTPKSGGVVHAFSGSHEQAKEYLKLGLHISFCATILDDSRKKIQNCATAIPAERLLVETDAPHQAPQGYSEWLPSHVSIVIEKLASLRDTSFKEISDVTANNASALFG